MNHILPRVDEILSSLSGGVIWPMLIYSYLWITNQEIMLSLIRIKVFFSTIDYHSG